MFRKKSRFPVPIAVLAVLATLLTMILAGCGGGRSAPSDEQGGGPAATSPEGASPEGISEEEDTTGLSEEPVDGEETTDVAGTLTRATKKKYDFIKTLRGPFGARGQDDPAAVRQATISGKVNGRADSRQVNLTQWSWSVDTIEAVKTPDAIRYARSSFGTHTIVWARNTDDKLTATVTGPAHVVFNSGPAHNRQLSGVAVVTIIDTARPGRVGDKVRIRFTDRDGLVFNDALLFSFTTDTSQGRDKAEIALLRNAAKPPK